MDPPPAMSSTASACGGAQGHRRTGSGICGLIKRDALDHPDIGYAFLARFSGRGFASEAGAAVLDYGRRALGLARIVAITKPDNDGSIRVLEKIGLKFDGMVTLPDHGGESRYFVSDL